MPFDSIFMSDFNFSLQVLSQTENPGIKYEYLMPINVKLPHSIQNSDESNSIEMEADMPPSAQTTEASALPEKSSSKASGEKRKHRYMWKVVSFSACSKSCGGGSLAPIIRCVRDGTNKFFNHKRCGHTTKPVLSESVLRCNTQPCPAFWKFDEWTACNCGLPNEHEYQSRDVKCVQELGAGIVMQVIEAACLEEKPPTKQECACPKIHRSHHGHHVHHKGAYRSPVTLIGNSTIGRKFVHLENKRAGVWLTSDWNNRCSTNCGEGIEYRSIFCDRSHPNVERCDFRLTPEATRHCTAIAKCNNGEWFIGPWSECTGDCFDLSRSRSIICIKNGQIVADEECNGTKTETIQPCEINDVSYCQPRWHYSEWTEVS